MRVLVTGGLGNIGRSTMAELVKQGHAVRCLDLRTRANAKAARSLGSQVEVMWGDLRNRDEVAAAVCDQEVVIHLAFIIPKLSSTGFESESHPEWAREINVGGTANLIAAMKAQAQPPRIIFASSYHIYGRTQHLPAPRTVYDFPQPIEHYALHKVECEQLIRWSGLTWAILRLAASLPLAMKLDPGMFDVPLDNRMEYVHTRDAGLAFCNAASRPDVWGKVLHVGGGPRCQYTYREITESVLEGLGVGALPDAAFSKAPFPTDWLDTDESQKILRYQQRTLDDYVQDMIAQLGFRRHLVRAARSLVRYFLLHQSPHYRTGQSGWLGAMVQGFKLFRGRPIRVKAG